MTSKKIFLGSGSPRRKELLNKLKIPFETIIKNTPDETYPPDLSKKDIPEFLAVQKASFYPEITNLDATILITADTIVLCNNDILGKPANYDEAFEMLRMLSGRSHNVITGVALTSKEKQKTFSCTTKVFFKQLTDDEINFYIREFKPFDKAGAYGIQEWIGMTGITKIEGSYFNVVGLPVQMLYTALLNF
ncbi:MAG: septum formation protein Maf [Chlorobi bacterium]|nr:septum formation protein Maf [Chlorobiota bacterium]